MARSGMSNLLARVRSMVDDAGTAVWTDDQLQDVLDQHKLRVWRERLEMEKTYVNASTTEYRRYHSRWGDYEEVTSGTAYFQIEDSSGNQRGTADYTADYVRGVIEMAADQEGTALFLSGWTYDLAGAAAQAWRERAGKVSSYYDVQADGHKLSRSQWMQHCVQMAQVYASQARPMVVRAWQDGVFDNE